MANPEVVRLDPERAPPATIERRDGARVRITRPDPLTTRTELARERLIIDSTRRRLTDNAGIARSHHVEAAIASRTGLGADQAKLIRELTGSGRGVEIVIGAAGSGKTYALGAAAEAWQRSGLRVLGTAHASIAAEQLSEAGIEARTIDSLRYAIENGRERLDRRTVLVVDEAEMAGNARLAELVGLTDRSGAKLVLVGDPAQLPAIDAGGMLRTLDRQFTTSITLNTNRRQQLEWERHAVDDLRNGRIQRALDAYQEHGRIHFHADADARATGIAQAAIADYRAGRTALVLTGTNDNVDLLNAKIQLGRWELGQLGPELGFSLHEEPIHEGDRVRLLHNAHHLDVKNGQIVTAVGQHPDGGLIVERQNGRRIVLDADYTRHHTRLGYASTTHRAQGATADVTHYAPDAMAARELGYVAASRGRAENVFHLIAEPNVVARAAARAAFEWQLRRSIAKTSAVDTGTPVEKTAPVPRTTPLRPQPRTAPDNTEDLTPVPGEDADGPSQQVAKSAHQQAWEQFLQAEARAQGMNHDL